MKKIKFIGLLLGFVLVTQTQATIYQDVAHNNLSKWKVYDNAPSGAHIRYAHNAIEFKGTGLSNGYILGNLEGKSGAWNNSSEKVIQWDMKFNQDFVIYIRVMTKKGARYIYYTASNKSNGKKNSYIHIGLDAKKNNDIWQTIKRDLEADLKKYEPNNTLLTVNAFLIRGNGFVDNIKLVSNNDTVSTVKGGKIDNHSVGSYYEWDDAESIRGLIFDVHKDCILKSVKVYNQKGEAGIRIFTLYDASGDVVSSESIYVKEGEQRIILNMRISKGNGYKLMADIHKGLYKNDNVIGYPYHINDILTIKSSDVGNSNYYFFYDWEVEFNKNTSPIRTAKTKAYIPKLDFNKDDVYGNGQVVTVDNANELKNAIINASAYTTILLENGTYENVHIKVPKGKSYITLKSKNKHGASIIPSGWDDGSAFIFSAASTTSESIHDINFIGLEITGNGKQFIKSEGGATYSVYNIYFKELNLHRLKMGIYSGLHSHDWTVDHCIMHDSEKSHMWYMMGWHHTVINSTFYNGSHDVIALRGYYPDGEKHTYIYEGDNSCHDNVYVENRNGREGFLAQKDWTHLIKNNKFLAWKRTDNQRWMSNSHIGIGYGLYGDPQCGAERVYLPPQNIEITNNIFSNDGEHQSLITNAITIDAWGGIESGKLSSINGTYIYDNTFIKNKPNEDFLKEGGDSGGIIVDISKINLKNNSMK